MCYPPILYDPVGNLKVQLTRRGDSLHTSYDALGRVSMHVIPVTKDTLKYRRGAASVDSVAIHNPAQGPHPFTRDTTTFEYDAVGRIRRAANPDARVARTYLYDAHGRMTARK